MSKLVRASLAGASVCALALSFGAINTTPSFAKMMEKTVEVGGAEMYPSKNIVENALNSKDHTTLVAAVKAAGLVDTLESKARSQSSHRPTQRSTSSRKARSRAFSSLKTRPS